MDNKTLGWGITTDDGSEIWDDVPVFSGSPVSWKEKLKLMFYPKKFVLYRFLKRALPLSGGAGGGLRNIEESVIPTDVENKYQTDEKPHSIQGGPASGGLTSLDRERKIRILDVGCGTGASVIDLKRLFGDRVEVVGLDVVRLQVDLAKERLKEEQVDAEVVWYDGEKFPFEDASFDAIYTSDVLGHVPDVVAWLSELSRVLKPGGALAMFSESALGKHAWMRRWFMKNGINTDPHAEFHISLHAKEEIKTFIENAGIEIKQMYSTVWAKFFVHPDELYPALQKQSKFKLLKKLNAWLYTLKKKTHPGYAAVAELYSLVEMLTIGRWIESQGYVILGRKNK